MAIGAARVFHVNVNCSSLECSLAFYRDAFGLEASARTAPDDVQPGEPLGWDGSCRWDAWILTGDRGFSGTAIDLLEWKTPEPLADPRPERTGFSRIALAVADLEACRAALEAMGAIIHDARPAFAREAGAGGGLASFVVHDPDGTEIEAVEEDAPGVAGVRIDCHDVERCARFYVDLLGFRPAPAAASPAGSASPRRHPLVDPEGQFRVELVELAGASADLAAHGGAVGSRRQRTPRPMQALGIHRMALATDDVDRDYARLRDAGVTCLTPPAEMSMGPGLPAIRFVCFLDPEGVVLELIEQPRER